MPHVTSSEDTPQLSPTDEKARSAVRVFRSMQPTLSAFARNLTGVKTVRVEMSATSNGHTDGKVIYFRPPITLGDMRPHDRNLCDRRDPTSGLQLCLACALREKVLVTIYHEISHIAFGTFDKADDASRSRAIEEALSGKSDAFARVFRDRIKKAHPAALATYLGLTRVISPYLPTLVNSLEDARIDSKMFEVRPGTRRMYEADNRQIFEHGVEGADGTLSLWKDAPLNMQVYVALYTKIIGYNYTDWFAPKVVADLDDEQIDTLCESVREAKSAKDTFNLGIDLLVRLKELGYCAEEDDPEPEPESESESNPQVEDETSEGSEDESNEIQPEGSEGGVPEPDEDGSEAEPGGGEGEDSGEAESEEGAGGGDDPQASGDEDSTDGPGDGGDNASGGEDGSEDSTGQGSMEFDNKEDSTSTEGSLDSGGPDDAPSEEDSSEDSEQSTVGGEVDDNQPRQGGGTDSDSLADGGFDPGRSDPHDGDLDTGDGTDPSGELVSSDSKDLSEGEVPGEASDDLPGRAEADSPNEEEESHGVRLIENEANDNIPMGDWSDVERGMKFVHIDSKPEVMEESAQEQDAVDTAVVQGIYFETPSRNITGVREHRYGEPIIVDEQDMSGGWDRSRGYLFGYDSTRSGRGMDLTIPETVLGPALLKMRVVFADNKRSGQQKHLKSGKINSRVLGRRANFDDERLFKRKLLPKKKDYFVQIGWDISSSNFGPNIQLGKRAIMAQAILLSRIGVNFSIIAHSGNYHSPQAFRHDGMDLEIYHVKDADEPFNSEVKKRLDEIGPDAANLDGHALEYLRKCVDKRTESDRIILYYSDGKMPAENYDEELVILRREIATCKQRGYTLLGVGIRTDSPTAHGLDTVQVNEDADIVHVIRQLERRLSVR